MDEYDEGFRTFVSARWPALVSTAYLVTADRGIAEDCVQEALARVHRQWRRLTVDGNPEAYARRAVLNAALSWRRRGRVREVPLEGAAQTPSGGALGPGVGSDRLDGDLIAALRSLPPRMRAAVVLRYVEDRSEQETADLLGCSVGTVKSSTHRGVGKLRRALGGHPDAAQVRAEGSAGTERGESELTTREAPS